MKGVIARSEMNATQIAAHMGVSLHTLERCMYGTRIPRFSTLQRILSCVDSELLVGYMYEKGSSVVAVNFGLEDGANRVIGLIETARLITGLSAAEYCKQSGVSVASFHFASSPGPGTFYKFMHGAGLKPVLLIRQ